MEQIILHLIGDYLLQNDWMAKHKARKSVLGFLACLVHVTIYTLPFLFFYNNGKAAAFIFITHFLIDKLALAKYWAMAMNWNWHSTNFGFDNAKPVWMSVWLLIIMDNTMHLICNYIALYLFL